MKIVKNFSKNEIAPIAEECIIYGLEDLQKEYENIKKPSIEEVRIVAQKFINEYQKADMEYQAWAKSNKASRKKFKQIQLLDGAREAFDEFQNKINLYFDQMVKVMYVYMAPETGEVTLSILDNSADNLRINPQYGSVEYHLDNIKNIFRQDDYDSTLLDAAEQSIYTRWNIAKKRSKKSRYLPILWKINGNWEGVKVNNLGTIAEAYVNFYLAKYEFSKYLEENVKDYMLNRQYGAISVDNASGFLIGDASVGNIQFAVKKQSASPMNMKRVYEETLKILNSPLFDVNYLKTVFVEEEKQRVKNNQVSAKLTNILQNKISREIIDDMESEFDNSIKL